MENLIKDIMQFLYDGNGTHVVQEFNLINEEKQDFKAVMINILGWLKLEYKRSEWMKEKKYVHYKPLDLNMNYPWCRILDALVKDDKRFSEFFIIEKGKFNFKESVSEEEKRMVRKIAFESYNPPMMR